jgi:ketosteroid isomerase-like protein
MKQSLQVKEALVGYLEAIGKGDVQTLARKLTSESGLRVIGTDPREWWSGRDEVLRLFKTQLAELGEMSLKIESSEGYEEGSAGWGAAQFTIDLEGTLIAARLSTVFHQEGGEWKVVQSHASVGAVNEEELGRTLTTE